MASYGTRPSPGHNTASSTPTPTPIRVLLADDSAVLRRNIRKLIGESAVTLEIHEAETVCDTLCYLRRFATDLLILDLQFGDGTGFDVLKQVGLLCERPVVVVLTNFPSEPNRTRARELGADYFLDKSYEYEQVLHVLELISRAGGTETSQSGTELGRGKT